MPNINPTFLTDGHTPRKSDPVWAIMQKTLGAFIDGPGGTGPDQNLVRPKLEETRRKSDAISTAQRR